MLLSASARHTVKQSRFYIFCFPLLAKQNLELIKNSKIWSVLIYLFIIINKSLKETETRMDSSHVTYSVIMLNMTSQQCKHGNTTPSMLSGVYLTWSYNPDIKVDVLPEYQLVTQIPYW